MGKKRGTTWPVKYEPVVHATQVEREEKYKGCFSRQHLRQMLRKDAYEKIVSEFAFGKGGHRVRRQLAIDRMHYQYRSIMRLPV